MTSPNATERATKATAAGAAVPAIPAHAASASPHLPPRLGASKAMTIPVAFLIGFQLLTSASLATVPPSDPSSSLHCHQFTDGYGYADGDGIAYGAFDHELNVGGPVASCGGCYCIPDNGTSSLCPSNGPPSRYPRSVVDALARQKPNGIYTIDCNPYEDEANCTVTPPSPSRDAGSTVMAATMAGAGGLDHDGDGTESSSGNTSGFVCGIKYDYDQNSMATTSIGTFLGGAEGEVLSSALPSAALREENCPKTYDMVTYPTWGEAEADGAFVTHLGACGVCSTTQDLAAYMANVDMTSKGTRCGIVTTVVGTNAGIRCYRKLGFTKECAKIWVYDSLNTNQYCHDICIEKTLERQCNNGPPPTCELNKCLQCDEDESGPIFKSVAGRTRRRSAVLSSIARPCSSIAPIVQDACPPPPQKHP